MRLQSPCPQRHTSSNKVTTPNNATSYGTNTQTHESNGAIPIQTTTGTYGFLCPTIDTCAHPYLLLSFSKQLENGASLDAD